MKIKLLPDAFRPVRAHETDAGMDIMTPIAVDVFPQSSAIIKTGVCIELPPNTVGFLKSKSGLNVKHSLTTEGVIDEGYTGEIVVKVYNNSNDLYTFYRGDKITQLVVLPCLYESIEIVDEIEGKERGNNGFGSTGK